MAEVPTQLAQWLEEGEARLHAPRLTANRGVASTPHGVTPSAAFATVYAVAAASRNDQHEAR